MANYVCMWCIIGPLFVIHEGRFMSVAKRIAACAPVGNNTEMVKPMNDNIE